MGCLYLIERSEIRRFSATPYLELANADFYICWLPTKTGFLPADLGDGGRFALERPAHADRERNEWAHDLENSLRVLQDRLTADVRLTEERSFDRIDVRQARPNLRGAQD